ncbi:hypothetical protein CAPTEDRAFT_224798 [Capitella teleta]|uniref:SOCS box domain-containing protein n=1 Tax=Capitella teleta TaxID=283909 RepID=R7V455_CAPTE|nr:hypothetical protein CAPTEDRAFT_224798 [Capitella teleta]|eukprot:ELU13628.1 hypothetical protein CAPTEDRAFT_224798 [Capitella teleta]
MSRSNSSSGGWVNRFWFAIENNDQRALRQMVQSGADVNHTFKEHGHRRYGLSPLFIAVCKNNRDLAGVLVSLGADVNGTNVEGDTVLFSAVRLGKLSMVKHLLALGAHVNCTNRHAESVLFYAIRNGRTDLVQYLISQQCHVNHISKQGSTALLEALHVYDKACSQRHPTRRSAPSNMADIIQTLIPLTEAINHQHPNLGSALRLAVNIETVHFRSSLTLSKLLLRHGAIPDRLFFLRFGGLNASTSTPGSEFFTVHFFRLAQLAGANLQRERPWLQTVLDEMRQELKPYEKLFQDLLEEACSPMSLQTICLISIRQFLGGRLWVKVDQLPLPHTVKDCLKLKHVDNDV